MSGPESVTIRGRVEQTTVQGSYSGGRGVKGDPGGNVMAVGLFTDLGALSVDVGTDLIQTSGNVAKGVGSARYVSTATTGETAYRTQTLNGRWFELSEPSVTPEYFGATGSDYTADTAAWQAAIDYVGASGGGRVRGSLRTYRLRNLTIDADNVELDFNGASILADPTTSGANGSPVVYASGVRGSPVVVTAVSEGSNVVTVDTGQGALFSAGQAVVLGDSKFIEPWNFGSGDTVGPGYNVRREVHEVKSVAGDNVTLKAVVERAYDVAESATLTPVTLLQRPQVHSIGELNEVNPGAAFTGDFDDYADVPHLFAYELCRSPVLRDVFVDGWQLHIGSFRECVDSIQERVEGVNPFRPTTGGHGYISRADRCRAALFQGNIGRGARHVVDDVQCLDTLSTNNTGYGSVATSFATHGHGALRFTSDSDCDYGVSGTIGWYVGNPSFSGDYHTTIINPRGSGGTNRIDVTCLSEDTTIINPMFEACGSRDIFIAAGAKRTIIRGGFMKAGPATSNTIYSRNKINTSDTFGIAPDSIIVDGVQIDTTLGLSTQVPVVLNCTGLAQVRNLTLEVGGTVNNAVEISRVDVGDPTTINVPSQVVVNGISTTGSGTTTGDLLRVCSAPAGTYVVTGVADNTAGHGLRLAVANQLIAVENHIGGTWTWDGDPIAAAAAGAIIRDNSPTPGAHLDHIVSKLIDTLYSKGAWIVGANGAAHSLNFGVTPGGSPNRLDQATPLWIVRSTSDLQAGGNTGADFEIVSRADDGSALESLLRFTRSTNKVTMNKGEFEIKGTWNAPLRIGTFRLWMQVATSQLMFKNGSPSSDSDGTVIGP